MIKSPSNGIGSRRFSHHLMMGGLGFWGVSVGGAHAPRLLRALFYPNSGEAPRYVLTPAQALGASTLWTLLVIWCVSWAFVAGDLARAWASRQGRPSWATSALLSLSLASPLVFTLAVSVLVRLATRDAYHVSGVIHYIPAVAAQLAISLTYLFLTGLRPLAALPHAEAT